MSGFEITKDTHLVIENGRLFFGGNYILEFSTDRYMFVNQGTRNNEPIERIPLNARTQRKARRETNLMSPIIKADKPRFITEAELKAKQEKQNAVKGTNAF